MLQRATEAIIEASSFVLPELTLSFYSDKEPVLLSEVKRISVDAVRVENGVLRLTSGGKDLLVAVNPDEETADMLINGSVSALAVTLLPDVDFKTQLVDGFVQKEWLYNVYAHKVFGWFLNASEKLFVTKDTEHPKVSACPIQMRVYRGKPYADFKQDCMSCMFCVDTSETGVVYCSGKQRIATVEDFKRTLDERKDLYDEFLQPDKVGLVLRGICPQCGGALVEKRGEAGLFLGCNHYPFCHFTAEKLPNGGVSFGF